MVSAALSWLGSLLGGPFAKAAVDAYRAKLAAENTSEKIAADLAARELSVEQRERELATEVLVAEQGRWYTALPRPLFASAFIIYVWKVVVWDKVLARPMRSQARCRNGPRPCSPLILAGVVSRRSRGFWQRNERVRSVRPRCLCLL